MRLVLVRHGSTVINERGQLRGWMDPDLSPLGVQQAKDVAVPTLPIYCSDLARAMQTANIVGGRIGVRPTPTPALRPWNVGSFAGLPTEIAHARLAVYAETDVRVPFGERFSDFLARFTTFLRTLREPCILVTHYRNFRILMGGDIAANVDVPRVLEVEHEV